VYVLLEVLLTPQAAADLSRSGYAWLVNLLNYQIGFIRVTRGLIGFAVAELTLGVAYLWLRRRDARRARR
jgi:hypothetical protein